MQTFFKTLLQYKFTILFVVYIFLIICIPVYFTGGVALWLHILPIVLMLYLIAKTNTYRILDVLFALMIGINAYFSFVFKSILNLGFLGSILETDGQEAISMLKEEGVPIFLIAVVTFVLVFGAIKELKGISFSRKIPLLIFALYSFLFLPYTCHRVLYSSGMTHFLERNPIFVWQRLINTHAPIFYGNLAVLASYGNEIYEFRKYRNMERTMPNGVVSESDATIEKIYFVLGESSWRNHYSLYGYNLPTTPFLDSLNNSESGILLALKGLTPAAITRNAVPLVMSFALVDDLSLYFKQKTILDLASMKGYETIWISNQSKIDDNDAMGGSSTSRIAVSASQTIFSDIAFSDDLNLLAKLDAVKVKNKKQFIVLHLSGSHLSYSDKYDEIDAAALVGKPSPELDYDRTIHHTDRFLAEIYKRMQQDSSSFIYYLSDHGEIINLGHGTCTRRSEFEVPLVTINNSDVAVDSLLNKYVDDDSLLFNTSNSIYVLAELMGYSVEDSVRKEAVERTTRIMYDQTKTLCFFDLSE